MRTSRFGNSTGWPDFVVPDCFASSRFDLFGNCRTSRHNFSVVSFAPGRPNFVVPDCFASSRSGLVGNCRANHHSFAAVSFAPGWPNFVVPDCSGLSRSGHFGSCRTSHHSLAAVSFAHCHRRCCADPDSVASIRPAWAAQPAESRRRCEIPRQEGSQVESRVGRPDRPAGGLTSICFPSPG